MPAITSLSFPSHPVLLHFKEDLHKNPADFENKKKLYYVAAVISGLVATALFLSFIPFQKMMIAFPWSIIETFASYYVGKRFAEKANNMFQNAKEAGKVANHLRELQNIYQIYKETSFSEPEKIIMAYGTLAEKEYTKTEQILQELITNTNFLSPQSRLEEIIRLQHEVLLLKIDVCFKAAIFDVVAAGNFNRLIEKKDLLRISDQDPLKRNQIQGLNNILKQKLTEPLVYFTKEFDFFRGFKNISFEEIEKMRFDDLTSHIFEIMITPSSIFFSEST